MKRDFLSILDLNEKEILNILKRAKKLKKNKKFEKILKGKIFALIFEKPSLRTRVSFEAGIKKLGGESIYLSSSDIKMGQRESVKDIAKNLERWVDGIIARVFSHNTLEILSSNSRIPVINALSDLEHPCQVLADLQTIEEFSGDYKGPLAFIGDGNNVCHSLILAFSLLGGKINVATPKGYEPKEEILKKAFEISKKTKAEIKITNDPYEAIKDVKFVYTDVWASMGQEHEAEERKKVFKDYQVNMDLIKKAKGKVYFMHCLPAHRGEEVTDEVLDSDFSIVYEQAENRLWSEMALFYHIYSRRRK
jgi:ornithine carbamoyltransferase